jgi:isoquinoline 1-oxidoreductase subunit beta
MNPVMQHGPEISRRGVLAGLGGLTFCVAIGNDQLALVSAAQANTMANAQITPWVRIAPDGTVMIYSAGAEMGQGSMTSLAIILAEEMDADWSKVNIEFAPADADIYGYTFQNQRAMAIVGSRAVQLYYNSLRTVGAQVRRLL